MLNFGLFDAHRAMCYKIKPKISCENCVQLINGIVAFGTVLINLSEECAIPFLSKEVGNYP
jgi:hypothetical protein